MDVYFRGVRLAGGEPQETPNDIKIQYMDHTSNIRSDLLRYTTPSDD